jgi:hypothetical protein
LIALDVASASNSMNATGIIGKFLWIGGATAFGLFIGLTSYGRRSMSFLR